jgi:hypothetical protein
MKNNKGFGLISLILIIVGVLLIAGGSYYFGKSYNKIAPVVEEHQNSSGNDVIANTIQSDCLLTTSPWIKILSPNGGETYTAGQQIEVKWKSCNMSTVDVGVSFVGYPYSDNGARFFPGKWINNSLGSEKITIPTNVLTGKYIVNVSTPGGESPYEAEDSSDNFFTIQAQKNTESNLISVNSDPYLVNMTNLGPRMGTSLYFLVKKEIGSNNAMYYYNVYSDIYSEIISEKPYIKDGKIYYNPKEQNEIIKFGDSVSGDISFFKESINKEITKNGYAIVLKFVDGGPKYINYTLIK